MPTHLVNLDALIQREDFESGDAVSGAGEPVFKLPELQRYALYFSVLRKPDFQRVTMDWSPEMIVEFIKSFLDGEVIPALILWRSNTTGKVFTIDGAHRLSAFIAWVNDDYGDGDISREFFGYDVQPAQSRFHKKTQTLMADTIGSYKQLVFAALNPQGQDQKMVLRGRTISTRQVPVQKVEGDASVAESSFFKINQNPAIISPIELALTRARRKPNAIAVRALIRAGTGHKYWGKFPNRTKEIEELAANVHDLLFGKIVEIESQTPDLPRAGQPYSAEAFTMILDMVNIFNDVTPAMWQQGDDRRKGRKSKPSVPTLEDDPDGTITLKFLNRIKSVGALITGNAYSGSLGFDQAVYSYAPTGKFHPSAFIASLKLGQELREENKLIEFCDVRRDFEEFLVRHKFFISALAHGKGGRTRPLQSLLKMHKLILDCLWTGIGNDDEIIVRLNADPQLADLKDPLEPASVSTRKKFSRSVQAAAVLREILANRARCDECGARLPPSARSKDHIERQDDGGVGTLENLQFTHPFCNTGYKEAKRARALKQTPNS
jgi:hypothetical protein